MTPRIKLYVFPREAKQVPTKPALEQHHQEIIKNSASCTYAMTTEDSRMRKFIFQGEHPGPPATGTRRPESVTNPVWLLPLLFCGLVCSAWDLLPPGGVLASLWDGQKSFRQPECRESTSTRADNLPAGYLSRGVTLLLLPVNVTHTHLFLSHVKTYRSRKCWIYDSQVM